MRDTKHEPQMRIGELAAALGLNPKTIRYYEALGLLPATPRTAGGYRLYGDAGRERLQFILKARAIGLTLEEIGEILTLRAQGEQPCEHVLALLDRKLAAADEHLRALEDFRGELASLRNEAAESIRLTGGGVCAIIEHHQSAHQTGPRLSAMTPASHRAPRQR